MDVLCVLLFLLITFSQTCFRFENLQTFFFFFNEGKEENKPTLHIEMNAENLTVSWKQSSLLADNLKGYVVQYKQFGSDLGHSFDWAKLNKSQTTAFFRGL